MPYAENAEIVLTEVTDSANASRKREGQVILFTTLTGDADRKIEIETAVL